MRSQCSMQVGVLSIPFQLLNSWPDIHEISYDVMPHAAVLTPQFLIPSNPYELYELDAGEIDTSVAWRKVLKWCTLTDLGNMSDFCETTI